MVWLNLSPIPVGEEGGILLVQIIFRYLSSLHVEEGGRESAPCGSTHLELLEAVQEGAHAGVKLGVPHEAKAAGPVQRQVPILSQHLQHIVAVPDPNSFFELLDPESEFGIRI
jgi:hypothetical protein